MDIDKIIADLSEEELEKFSQAIKNQKAYLTENKIKEIIKQHKKYIGKCYKKPIDFRNINLSGFRYLKFIRADSENEYWMEALMFENPVHFCFDYKCHKMHFPGDYIFGNIDYDGIRVESIGWFTQGGSYGYQEITEEEFNLALDEHIKELKRIDWTVSNN